MPRAIPQTPTEQLVQQYLVEFRCDERYFLADKAILELVQQFPNNKALKHILLKVVTINDLYGTNIYATFAMAHHIHTLRIDRELAAASPEIVDKIAAVTFSGKPRNVFHSHRSIVVGMIHSTTRFTTIMLRSSCSLTAAKTDSRSSGTRSCDTTGATRRSFLPFAITII
jgi:hypothetical protein